MTRTKKMRSALAIAAAATMITATACSSGGTTAGGGEGIADQIQIQAVNDQTGAVAYAGTGASRGAALAIEEINEQAFLGDGVTITMEQSDPAGEIDRAVAEVTTAAGNPEISAILGPTMGQQAAAVAPIVNQREVPTIFTQSGSDGVVTGDYTFRATAPMESYYGTAMQWLADNDLTDISVIYNATFPTFATLGADVVPAEAEDRGITVGTSIEAQSTTQDFTGQAQQIASADPQAVVMLLTAPQSVTFLSQLRRAGYDGQVVGTSVQSAGNVEAAGAAADGLVYPVDYSPAMDSETAQQFASAFEAKYGEQPDLYDAEGYDAMWWLARGIQASGSSSREGIQQGLTQVAEDGFTGAMGDITFEGNDMRVPGVMIQWENGQETLVS
ncbi:ABC transporter substrate-binding protein [Gordonia mangrovi]|nr:ABC transporter substrate-binding protein [Gordonia mangrovi]UVF79942.1 ABC transporter substrate-binding protein [Gordonia mangrovi]